MQFLTPACFDAFGVGALLAYAQQHPGEKNLLVLRCVTDKRFFFLALISLLVLIFVPQLPHHAFWWTVFFKFVVSVVSVFLIGMAAAGSNGWMNVVFGNQPVVFIGKISYGLYVYHNFVPRLLDKVDYKNRIAAWVTLPGLVLNIVIPGLVLLLVAVLSWYAVEKPCNRLKKYFP